MSAKNATFFITDGAIIVMYSWIDWWKKANIVPAYEKGDNQLINNYWPVSLLAIHAKAFQKIIFERLDNNQTRFASGDSCVHQLISIAY